jgi:hypothetical protein
MTWTKLSDGFNDDPDLLALPRGIRLMHVEALVWSNAHGTDGKVPRHVLTRITDEPDPAAAAEQLVAAGLWTLTVAGWSIAFGDQLPAGEVQKRREATALRTRRWDHHRNDIHDLCLPRYCKQADASGETSGNASGDALPPDPPALPARVGRERERSGIEAGDAVADAGGDQSPAVATSPAEVRWLPIRADDYGAEPWRDAFIQCERCLGYFPEAIVPENDDDQWHCPACWEAVKRRSNKDCFAFTTPKRDEPSRPCRQPRLAGSRWCRYHEREVSRGQAPPDWRQGIDRAADKAIEAVAQLMVAS